MRRMFCVHTFSGPKKRELNTRLWNGDCCAYFDLFFRSDDGGSTFLRKVDKLLPRHIIEDDTFHFLAFSHLFFVFCGSQFICQNWFWLGDLRTRACRRSVLVQTSGDVSRSPLGGIRGLESYVKLSCCSSATLQLQQFPADNDAEIQMQCCKTCVIISEDIAGQPCSKVFVCM